MIPILLDPWLVQFSSNDSNDVINSKMGALKRYNELQNQHPLEVVPFLSQEELSNFWSEFPKCKFVADKMNVVRYIYVLSLKRDQQVEPARITDNPCPSLPESWLRALAGNGNSDVPPAWRRPMVLLPVSRRNNWPNVDEFQYSHAGGDKKRNLVLIEDYRNHAYFMTDIEPLYPWCLGCLERPVRKNGSLEQKQRTWKRLPCPPQFNGTRTLRELADRLHQRITFANDDSHIYFVPDDVWQPLDITRQAWRDGCFPEDSVSRGPKARKAGYIDRAGRIWVWDQNECHWDVQIDDGAEYRKVSYTGKNLRF